MDLDREGLAVVCYTSRAIIKGKIALLDLPAVSDGVHVNHGGPAMLHLSEASLLDFEFRVVHRAREMAVNRDAILFAYEDDHAADVGRLKGMIANEDYETASAEAERLLLTNRRDAELYYLSGLIFEHSDAEARARECFQKALSLILDDKFRAVVASHIVDGPA